MNRILALRILPLLSVLVLIFFFTFALVACSPTCASDSDCAVDAVCLVDADGAHCAAIALPVRGELDGTSLDVEFVDDELQDDDADDVDASASGIVLRDASMSFAPDARAATIVMRPITVIVTRSPSLTSPNTTRSKP